MNNMMRICGKTPTDTAKAVNVSAAGNVVTEKKWAVNVVKEFDAYELRDTSGHSAETIVDVQEAAMVSLRVRTSLDKEVTLRVNNDVSDLSIGGGTTVLQNLDKTDALTIPASNGTRVDMYIVTPYDAPMLNYLRKIRVRLVAGEAPTAGNITVAVVTKR